MIRGKKGYLSVGQGHQVYYETYGHPNAPPVLFIHGGPGGHISRADLDFFDLDQTYLILFDQRGCGKSRPKGALENNTTQNLIDDIQQLLDFFGLKKVTLFGGSWGSTLAMLFTIAHPQRVTRMVLRGVFTGSKRDRLFFEKGGFRHFYPNVWRRFASLVPSENQEKVNAYYHQKILADTGLVSQTYAYELMYAGMMLARMQPNVEMVRDYLKTADYFNDARILAHYSVHDFFIPDEFIMNQLGKIALIPTIIVQGQFDLITTPDIAHRVFERLENAEIYLVESGHAPSEEATKGRLREVMVK